MSGAQQPIFGNPYNPLVMLKKFLAYEASGGILLVLAAICAMIIANSALAPVYHHVLHDVYMHIGIDGVFSLDKHIIHWINDGLMAVFFFLIGLEMKRELMEGNLNTVDKALLPLIAAIGGMIMPGLLFYATAHASEIAVRGWAIPAATDIAFALGLLTLLGKRVPLSLKVFLLALAIFDDLGAIIIIALFYTSSLDVVSLYWAVGLLGILAVMNRLHISNGTAYIVVGVCLWFCVLKSGVHATLAGVATAFFIPLMSKYDRRSLLRQLEHHLHPFVAFIILPIFAFANAGISLQGMTTDVLFDYVTLGVILGLFFGKQIGIFGFTWLAVKLRIATLPSGVNWFQLWGVSLLAGIGFTMSIFIASLAYIGHDLYLTEAKLGILVGSCLSAVGGMLLLLLGCRKPANQEHAV